MVGSGEVAEQHGGAGGRGASQTGRGRRRSESNVGDGQLCLKCNFSMSRFGLTVVDQEPREVVYFSLLRTEAQVTSGE